MAVLAFPPRYRFDQRLSTSTQASPARRRELRLEDDVARVETHLLLLPGDDFAHGSMTADAKETAWDDYLC